MQWHSRSQTTPGHCMHLLVCFFFFFFLVGGGGGGGGGLGASLINFCILEVATQIFLETTFEMPSVLNQE